MTRCCTLHQPDVEHLTTKQVGKQAPEPQVAAPRRAPSAQKPLQRTVTPAQQTLKVCHCRGLEGSFSAISSTCSLSLDVSLAAWWSRLAVSTCCRDYNLDVSVMQSISMALSPRAPMFGGSFKGRGSADADAPRDAGHFVVQPGGNFHTPIRR